MPIATVSSLFQNSIFFLSLLSHWSLLHVSLGDQRDLLKPNSLSCLNISFDASKPVIIYFHSHSLVFKTFYYLISSHYYISSSAKYISSPELLTHTQACYSPFYLQAFLWISIDTFSPSNDVREGNVWQNIFIVQDLLQLSPPLWSAPHTRFSQNQSRFAHYLAKALGLLLPYSTIRVAWLFPLISCSLQREDCVFLPGWCQSWLCYLVWLVKYEWNWHMSLPGRKWEVLKYFTERLSR